MFLGGRVDKPFKSILEQASLLESRGVCIDSETPDILMREGYYSVVNGYKDPFLDKAASVAAGDDKYVIGTKFSDIYNLFKFDRKLRLLMFGRFSVAEETLKTVVSYRFSERHIGEIEPYLNPANYAADKRHVERLISEFNDALGRNRSRPPRKKLYLDHYVLNHDEVPLWVIMKYMTLGQAFKFYCFQPEAIRNAVAKTFSDLYAACHTEPVFISQKRLRLAFDHIKDFRNICAHDERLYCARVSPSADVAIGDVVKDLRLVLSEAEYSDFLAECMAMVSALSEDINPSVMESVVGCMRMSSVEETLATNE